MTSRRRVLLMALLPGFASLIAAAQMRVVPLDAEGGHVALGLALRHLANTGIFMNATAHPDDEDNGLLVMLNRGQGFRTALATATRGNGGQNEIGPEIFEALGVLRTEELAALHRFDGTEQYFTRAVDFGYSFSIDETFEKWGREDITGDYVRLIRMIRPDVIVSLRPDGRGGGQHHQASAVIAREAFKLAGDPAKYPEQLKDGLRPWQPRKFYFPAQGFGGRGAAPDPASRAVSVNLAAYDPLLGKTYAEIGTEARSMHKSQGMAQLLALPGPSVGAFQLVESTIPGGVDRVERGLFDGLDQSIAGLAQFAGARPARELTNALATIAGAVQEAQKKFDTVGDEAAVQPLLIGLSAVRRTRALVRTLPIDDGGRFEIEFRLRQKEREFQQAVLLANGLRVEALADDGTVVPGQPVHLSIVVANRGAADVTVKDVKIDGFSGTPSCQLTAASGDGIPGPGGRGRGAAPSPPGTPMPTVKKDQTARCEPSVVIPENAKITEPYWHRQGEAGRYTFDPDAPFGLPYGPTPFYVQMTLAFAGSAEEVISGLPVQHRYEGDIFTGEKRSELLVVPALSVNVSPEVAIVSTSPPTAAPSVPPRAPAPTRGAGRGTTGTRPSAPAGRSGSPPPPPPPPQIPIREVRVTVVNDTKGATDTSVKLNAPDGWTASPAQQAIKFAREDEAQTARFQLRPPQNVSSGEYLVGAEATAGEKSFDRGFQVIEYPHITRKHIYHDATTRVKAIDVKTALNVTVGYIMGVGDEVPAAIAQLGAKVEMLNADDLAWGDLSRFPVIVTGVRAYERRGDLRANNSRLLEYVHGGGTLVVQYNKFEFNEAQYGPYPAQVTSERVTDESAPVKVLAPSDALFTTPNRITDAAWRHWVQERGLYFLGDLDSRYRDLVELEDSFPNNPGVKRGALVSATFGKGRWIYVGLGLWRELPAGVEGAYQLLANLISLR